MRLLLTLVLALGLIPAPVEYSPEKSHVCFKKAVASLEPWQRQEAYRISFTKGRAKIEALTPEGRFRAGKTLEQLKALGELPTGTIFDYPRLRHRGLMIDESRSFKGLDFLKKQIDAMALLKLNVLHLHLDDSAGWRIESEAYPFLTGKTAFRKGRTYHEWEAGKYQFTTADDPEGYGGYYTKEELKELVAYAAERYITVIPEIEMPGHSMEVGYAYPEVLCVLPDGRLHTGAWDLCPGNEATYKLLEAVLTEVMDIFPSPLIHIGGDEATMKTWSQCVNCRSRMEEEGYTDVKQLQGYLVRRIEAFVRSHGRRIIGWDEILQGELQDGATIMSWRGTTGGVAAAEKGFNVIMAPNTYCYLDYYQSEEQDKEPLSIGRHLPIEKVYGFEPFEGLAPGTESHILGVQANLWTEYIAEPAHLEYMMLPRLCAVSEVQWCDADRKDYERFLGALDHSLAIFDVMGYTYAKHVKGLIGLPGEEQPAEAPAE